MEELKNKRLLLLGGGTWKNAIKRFAVEHDITLIATGNDASGGIFSIADEKYTINSIDAPAMKNLIKEKKIDGVYMGGSETVINIASEYLNELGLPCYCNKMQWDFLQNKANFKQLCIDSGLPVVPRFPINPTNIADSVPRNAYPVITKPTDGCGSNGFSVCRNEEELVAGFYKAAADSPTQSVLCEKFVKNTGVVVFYTFSNGEVIFSGLEDKYPVKFDNHSSYVGGLFTFESKFTNDFRQRFDSKVEKMFKSIGIKEGSAWIEVFHDGNDYYFNEVGFRYGGSISIYPVDYLTGINQVAADIYYALTGMSQLYGHTSLIPSDIERGLNYAIYPIYVGPGIISKIEGLDKLGDNIVFRTLTKPIGCRINDCGSFNQNAAVIHFVYRDDLGLKQTIETFHSNFKIYDENGNNMIIRLLDKEFVN